ncbi:MAG TPA: DUF2785 domain-containing protein [Vicinamibacteria bacterium]|jgi:hypothetical protein
MIALLLLTCAVASDQEAPSSAEQRGKPFWKEVARECDVPPWATPSGLAHEAITLVGSPDPEWRDDIGYGVVAACIQKKQRLSAAERRSLVEPLLLNLRKGIGDTGNDSVLQRSFSALTLSLVAAAELREPALDAPGYRRLLDDALAYLRDERDLRGFEPRVGWIHATAHTADLLKFLARDSRFTSDDQLRLLEAAWTRMAASSAPVFTHAEDERLAAALVSVVRRDDFEASRLDGWLQRFATLEKQVWAKSPPDPQALDAAQNARNLLRSFYVLLSLPQPPPTAGQMAARDKLLATLQQIRR